MSSWTRDQSNRRVIKEGLDNNCWSILCHSVWRMIFFQVCWLIDFCHPFNMRFLSVSAQISGSPNPKSQTQEESSRIAAPGCQAWFTCVPSLRWSAWSSCSSCTLGFQSKSGVGEAAHWCEVFSFDTSCEASIWKDRMRYSLLYIWYFEMQKKDKTCWLCAFFLKNKDWYNAAANCTFFERYKCVVYVPCHMCHAQRSASLRKDSVCLLAIDEAHCTLTAMSFLPFSWISERWTS